MSPAGPPDETEMVTGAGQLLSSAVSNDLSASFDPAQGGWIASSQSVDPYTGVAGGSDSLSAFTGGQAIDPYTGVTAVSDNPNSYTGGQNVDPFSGVQNAASFTGGGGSLPNSSDLSASNGPIVASESASAPQNAFQYGPAASLTGGGGSLLNSPDLLASNGPIVASESASAPQNAFQYGPATSLTGGGGSLLKSPDLLASNGQIVANGSGSNAAPAGVPSQVTSQGTTDIDGNRVGWDVVTIDGGQYNHYFNDMLHIDLWEPATSVVTPPAANQTAQPAPAAPSTGAPPTAAPPTAPVAPPASIQGVPRAPSSPSDSWGLGDLLATIAGLFSPTSVGPYMNPQTPANLPGGLQQMAQMNAQMAQQSLQDAGARTRAGIVAAGIPYVAAEAALAAPAAGSLGYEGSLMAASRFPTATAVATDLGNALTGTTIPRVAIGVGGATLAAGAAGELPALGPELPSSLPLPTLPSEAAGALAPEIQASTPAAQSESALVNQNLQHVLRGGSGDRGIGVLHLDGSKLNPAEVQTAVASVREMDFQAGMAGGLIRSSVSSRSIADSVTRLARSSSAIDLGADVAGHLPDVAGGGSPYGPIMGLPRSVNSSIGGQFGGNSRYAPGFTFDGFSLVDRSTGAYLYMSQGLEEEPSLILDFR
jgi:hypothetical protein